MIVILVILLILSCIFFSYVYNSLNKKYNNLIDKASTLIDELNKPLRMGYYKMTCIQDNTIDYFPIVYVSEIDRYTNGECKIKLERVEISCGNKNFSVTSAEIFVRKEFKSLVNITDITWLESEQTIKDQRKNKLKQLENNLK